MGGKEMAVGEGKMVTIHSASLFTHMQEVETRLRTFLDFTFAHKKAHF
jgi:hypothetical protein